MTKRNPKFIKIALFPSPKAAADWSGTAAQISGDGITGEVVLLSETYSNSDLYLAGGRYTLSEWEWDGGVPLTGMALVDAIKDYHALRQKLEAVYRINETLYLQIDRAYPGAYSFSVYDYHLIELLRGELDGDSLEDVRDKVMLMHDIPIRVVEHVPADDFAHMLETQFQR